METIKTIHVVCALLSITGFFIRGIWMLQGSALLNQRLVKIAPHIVVTLLLASAVMLAVGMQLSPMQQPWLMAKIIALVVYIAAGLVALRFGRTRVVRAVAWVFGLLTFGYIVSVAVSKSVLGWFVYI